ncbi:hypothetical protein [Pseudarthrobacter sp. NS4]|uniref:hypothetical protein n=1 Tax=Pseudarthrobacter sp. NS4 TaxID=2973976 RepID=UPI0021619C38|nr:hypothetical protein [Pseudarthrobacter sp. NS4]
MATARGVLLFSRSLLVTGIAVFLASGAHVAGGGGTPPPTLLAALTALLLPPVVLLSRRQLSLPVLTSVLSTGQLLLHGAFSLFLPETACAAPGPAGHIHHTVAATTCAPGATAGERLAEAAGHGWPMTVAHAVAVLFTALLLARGETALWHLLAWLRPLVRIPVPARLPAPTPCLLTSSHFHAPASSTDACVHRLRGPPVPA